MFKNSRAFSGFSVGNLAEAKEFYGEKLGLDVREENGMGLSLNLAGGAHVFIYEKENHEPATYTVLNFPVSDIDAAVQELVKRGIKLERYLNMHQDEAGIARGRAAGMGPDIAWFTDPAGNVLSVLQEK